MMAKIHRTPRATKSLIEIGKYVEEQSQSLEIANRLLDSIESKCAQYARQPLMGETRPDLGEAVRSFTVGSYVVLYEPLSDGIRLLWVVHGARDIPAAFRQDFIE